MSRFVIKKVEPEVYREQIIKLWKDCLPGTPEERFSWMMGNPDGAPIWYLAFESGSQILAGAISVMPRKIIINGKELYVGIVGDYMVADGYRVFGPAIELQKFVVSAVQKNNFDYIYTLPNSASVKLIKKAGYKCAKTISYYVKPISVFYYLDKHLYKLVAQLLSPLVSGLIRMVSKETYIFMRQNYKDLVYKNDLFGKIFLHNLVGEKYNEHDRVHQYLNWRYLNNYYYSFQIIALEEGCGEGIAGFIVFSIQGGKMEIFDLVAINNRITDCLLKKVIKIARERQCQAIYMRLSLGHELIRNLKWFGFFNAKDNMCVFAYGEEGNGYARWSYVEGDRNI